MFFLYQNLVSAQFYFTDATSIAGIDFEHHDGRSGQRYFIETLGSGAAWFDYDQDGDPDMFFVNGANLVDNHSTAQPTNKLYRNNGDGTFTNVGEKANVADNKWGTSCAFADYDRDGDLDLFVANYVNYQVHLSIRRTRYLPRGPKSRRFIKFVNYYY